MPRKITVAVVFLAVCLLFDIAISLEAAFEWQHVRSGRVVLELYSIIPDDAIINSDGGIITGVNDLDRILLEISAVDLVQSVPNFHPELYLVTFPDEFSVEEVIEKLRAWPGVKNAWPCVLLPWSELKYYPDDLLMPGQWHLEAIEAPAAWAIHRGSSESQVAIIDGGVNYVHPDLAANIWVNPGEDLNGNRIIEPEEIDCIDNDGNGYVDDFWGWDWIDFSDSTAVWPGEDWGTPDNDPSDFDGHGTHCAGDACAVADNEIGVASPGFNCQIMPLRAGWLSASGQGYVGLYEATQAVYYAVSMDAEVISMSFGGPGVVPYFQEALQYASNNGLIPVAAAGNESTSMISYPAGYDFVIAVAATAPGDVLADFTNYGDWITLCAPGEAIKSTIIEGYSNMSGTSMATPVVAGVAASVKSLLPTWTYSNVSSWLSQTADNIDAQNPGFIGMMGGGRLNAARALDLMVTIDSIWVDNGQGGTRLLYDQEGSLFVQYHKFYGSATDLQLTLSCSNPRVVITQPDHTIGTLNAGQSGDNTGEPFILTVQNGGDDFETIEMQAHFTGADLDFTQILEVPVGQPQILLIDADHNNEERTASYYEDVLDEIGYSWEMWRRADRSELGSDLLNYEAIIHFSGTAETNIFPEGDMDDLDDYLDSGGKLLISGQNVIEDLSVTQPTLLFTMFRISYLAPHSENLVVHGSEGNPLTDGMYFVLAGENGAGNQYSMDVIAALPGGADPYFVYRLDTPDELAGIRVQTSVYDLFLCCFGIEGINDSTSTGNTRHDILSMILDEFGITPVQETPEFYLPAEVNLYPPFPNPFNSQLKITYELPAAGPLTIDIYNILGKRVATWKNELSPAGSSEWLWKTDAHLTSGIYIIRLDAFEAVQHRKILYLK